MLVEHLNQSMAALRQALASCPFFPRLLDGKDKLEALIGQVQHGLDAPDRPFRLVLAGGTGVGKSTLLNALAGAPIARVGEQRPTTSGFTVYLHTDDEDPWLESLNDVSLVRHQRPELKGKAIIDSPDADSAIREHRIALEQTLTLADLVLVVVTEEKYVSESVMDLIRTNIRGREYVFVFNKMDLRDSKATCELVESFRGETSAQSTKSPMKSEVSSEVVADFEQVLRGMGFVENNIFPISAKAATAKEEPVSAYFLAMSDYIETVLDRKEMRRIERSNVMERITILSGHLSSLLPDRWETASERWQETVGGHFSKFMSEVAASLARKALRRDEFAAAITSARGSALSGPFGFLSELIYAVRRFRQKIHVFAGAGEVEAWVRNRLGRKFPKDLERRDALLLESCAQLGIEVGLSPESLRRVLEASQSPDRGIALWMESHLASLIQGELERQSRPPGKLVSVIVNIPVWGWIGYWAYKILEPVLSGRTCPWDAIPGAALVLMVLMLGEWSIVHWLLSRDGRKRADGVVSSVLSGFEADFLGDRKRAISTVAARIEMCTNLLGQSLNALRHVRISS